MVRYRWQRREEDPGLLLIVVMIVTGLPLPVMGATGCADFNVMGTTVAGCTTAVVLAAAALLLVLVGGRRLSAWLSALVDLVAGTGLFRPPRLA